MAAAAVAVVVLAAVGFLVLGGGDSIPDSETQARQAAYDQFIASGGRLQLPMVKFDEVDSAVASMPVSDQERQQIREQVADNRIQLAWLTLWDTHAEDGDILEFTASGAVPVQVTALNAPTTLAIPFPPDGKVLVRGVRDGGGGITIALKSGAAEIAWPTMQVNQTLMLPVTPGY